MRRAQQAFHDAVRVQASGCQKKLLLVDGFPVHGLAKGSAQDRVATRLQLQPFKCLVQPHLQALGALGMGHGVQLPLNHLQLRKVRAADQQQIKCARTAFIVVLQDQVLPKVEAQGF